MSQKKHTPKSQKKQAQPTIRPVFPRSVYVSWLQRNLGDRDQKARYQEILDNWPVDQPLPTPPKPTSEAVPPSLFEQPYHTLLTLEREPSAPVPAGEGVVALNADSPTFYPSEERA